MADQFDVHVASFPIGICADSGAGTVNLMFIPKVAGAITIQKALLVNSRTATGTINAPVLIYMKDATIPTMAGTLGTAALWTITGGAGTSSAVTLSQAYIQPGTADAWLGISYTSGTVLAGDPTVQIVYTMGR